MAHILFDRPAFSPQNLVAHDQPAALETALDNAEAAYQAFLTNTLCPAQAQWVNDVIGNDNAREDDKALANVVIAFDAPYSAYTLSGGRRDLILNKCGVLFTYMSEDHMNAHISHHGLHVSFGAEQLESHQRGEFPKGAYGTTIPPYAQNVGRNVMARKFFDIGYSLPSVQTNPQTAPVYDQPRTVLDTGYWVAFCPTASFSAKGRLDFPRLVTGIQQDFDHYVLPTPNHNVDDFLPFDLVAYGKTLIPNEVPEWMRAHTSSQEERAPVRDGTLSPVKASSRANIVMKRRSTGDTF